MNDERTKICTECNQEKPLSMFYHRKRGDYSQECKSCFKVVMNRYYHPNIKLHSKYTNLRRHAKMTGVACLSFAEFERWYEEQDDGCHYCHRDLQDGTRKGLTSKTVDRKDSKLGYTPENMVIACTRCNIIKGNWFTETEMLTIASKYKLNKR